MKIFASDYDGTIKIDNKVSNENIKALNEWKQLGNKFGIVTGRSAESSIQEIKHNGFDIDFLICNNGGVIYDEKMNLLKLYEINFDVALSLLEEIKKMDCTSFVVNDGYHRAKEVVNNSIEDYKYGTYSAEYSVEKIIKAKKIAQIVISLNDNEYGSKIAAYINDKYHEYMVAYPNVNCVDIVPVGVSKAEGIKYIQNHFNYIYEDIHVMGDSYNDLPMLISYQGATLNHAPKEIIDSCKVIVEDVAQYLKMIEK